MNYDEWPVEDLVLEYNLIEDPEAEAQILNELAMRLDALESVRRAKTRFEKLLILNDALRQYDIRLDPPAYFQAGSAGA